MENRLVSIIIPIYKVSEYLDKCVTSACNQTYRNLEIILVDDGSPDDCPAKCDAWAKKDDRIRVIHKSNGGLSDARNAGLDEVTGEYIYFLDGDDYIEPDLIEKTMRHMAEDVDMVSFGCFVDQAGKPTRQIMPHSGIFELQTAEQKQRFVVADILDWSGWEAWRRLLRKSVIDKFHLRFEDNKKIFAEDLYFCLCYVAHAGKCVAINDCLYHYIVRSDSIMGTDSVRLNIGRMNELSKAVKSHYEKYDDCKALLDVFPIIHYLIIDNSLKVALNRGIHIRQLRDMALQDVQDKDYFLSQLKAAYALRKKFYLWLGSWSATERVNTCRYLSNGSYTELRVRSRLLYRFPDYYERKGAKLKGIDQEIREFSKNKKKIYLVGTEDFGNLGDHQITESIVSFLRSRFPDYAVKEVTQSEYSLYKMSLEKHINKSDVIVFTGGGNMGDVYLGAHNLRMDVIQTWPRNLKLIFPQTIYFQNEAEGAPILTQCRDILTRENNVVLFAREKPSFELAQKYFTCESILVPDIVLSTNLQTDTPRENQILLCFRADAEKSITDNLVDQICCVVNETDAFVKKTDLQLDFHMSKNDRREYISKAIAVWRESKLVITDRLHGMVFAAITGTPCIVLSNYNHKVRGTYEWLRHLPYIRYAESVTDVEKYLPELLEMENCQYDNTPLMPYFDKIAEVVKRYAHN